MSSSIEIFLFSCREVCGSVIFRVAWFVFGEVIFDRFRVFCFLFCLLVCLRFVYWRLGVVAEFGIGIVGCLGGGVVFKLVGSFLR